MKKISVSYADGVNNVNLSPKNNLGTSGIFKNDPPKEEPVESSFKPWRVFINHVDSYHGRKLVDLLSDRVYVNPQGEDLGEEEEEELGVEEEEQERNERLEQTMNLVAGDVKLQDLADSPRKYEVIGTISSPEHSAPEDVVMIIKDARNRDALLQELMKCGIVIYDITQDQGQVEEARWALKYIVQQLEKMEQISPKAFKRNNEIRNFILISTLMTWANTKPLNPDEPDLPFTEEDYRKRKPHPNFKEHIQCEKEVVIVKKKTKLKDKLKTLVICCGVTYGEEQGPLHHLFKMAWQNAPFLPIIGKGNNNIPLLHIRDLSNVVLDVLQNWPPLRYIVAAEQEPTSQSTIVKKISRALTTGKVKKIAQEEAFLLPEITQRTYDLMTMNLIVDPVYITDRISWHLDTPFSDSINAIVREYKAARNLNPIKIIVLGPPASGKSKVARYLADHYEIHYIHVKSLIADTIENLSNEVEEATTAVEQDEAEQTLEDADEGDEDVEEDRATKVEEMQELLDEIERNMQRTNGRLDEPLLNKLFLRKLRSKECLNQGYVMDGHPKTLEQAKTLFGGESLTEFDEELGEDAEIDTMHSIMPELVVSLEASDEFLKERIIQRPEKEIQGTHYTEEHMMRRLKEYRKRNTDDNTPLNFFDEIEIHPLIIDVEDDVCPDMFPTIYQCLQRVGPPRNYGLTAEETRNARERAEAEARATEAAVKLQQEREFLEHKRLREEKMEEWTNLMEKLKEEQEERLCLASLPLRHYLMKYVFPTLTQGLIEVANLRPEDPVDFLAEYLFKENPEGKMFEPEYTKAMASVLEMIDKYGNFVLPEEEVSDKMFEFLKRERSKSEEVMDSSDIDVCTSRKTCITPCFTYEDTDTYEGEGESERTISEQIYDKED
ncbi:adenylate kinase 7 [Bombus fervidus]|uniref:adenylate kinase 7 n=1 Tax=Bombus fervidus TaxID=203811 RepID=UPI003AB88CAA